MSFFRLFVYGTLKKGFSANSLLGDAEFLGNASTSPGYFLLNCGEYPGLVRLAGLKTVQGELYAVSQETLARLDQHEGVPTLYTREKIDLEGVDRLVDTYFYRGPMAGKTLVKTGIWES